MIDKSTIPVGLSCQTETNKYRQCLKDSNSTGCGRICAHLAKELEDCRRRRRHRQQPFLDKGKNQTPTQTHTQTQPNPTNQSN